MARKLLCVILLLALPFLFEANTGCLLDAGAYQCDADCEKPPEQSNPNSYLCSCTCTPESRHLEVRVTASSDDAEQTTQAIVLDSPVLHLDPLQVDGLRFVKVDVPMGAHITNAYVQFTALDSVDQNVTFKVVGEAADDGATFVAAANNVSGRPATSPASDVTWNLPAWTAGDAGFDQRTPDLTAILQEIVGRAGWSSGNAVVLIFMPTAGAGSRSAVTYDGNPFSAPLLVIDYEEPVVTLVGPQELPVCVPPDLNPNLPGGAQATDVQLIADCVGRVESTFSGLSNACGYPSQCDCTVVADSRRFSDACDHTCVEDPVDADCSDFNPITGDVKATNATGDAPVCLANSPLAFGIYGRRTTCNVRGTAHVEVQGDSADPSAAGVLQFRGTPCPGHPCSVGMEYRLDIGSVMFRNVFGSETFTDLEGLGETAAGQDAVLTRDGAGRFVPGACLLSARGQRGRDARALVMANTSAVDVNVLFGSINPSCSLNGAMVGGVDPELKRCARGGNICREDADCDAGDRCSAVGFSDLLLRLDVGGEIVNQPPSADAGADQRVECPAPAVLDASHSSDLDSNIALFSWRRGSRNGDEVGFAEVSNVEQGLGRQTYVLRVIDALGQTDEDTTTVNVVDTKPPVLSCSVAMPIIQDTNHNLINVGLAARARDACQGELPVTVHVFGDEDDEMQVGDSNFSPDAKNINVGSLRLRAERQATGDGRVYLIVTDATDSSGNRGSNCCTVVVPQSHSPAALRSVQSQAANARAYCLAHDGMPPRGYFVVGDGRVIGLKQ